MRYKAALAILLSTMVGCKYNLPPSQQLQHPGPGVTGPGPGVLEVGPPAMGFPGATSQLAFIGPDVEGMVITFDVGGHGQFDSEPLVAPARYNFAQGAIYRLKLTNIPGRPGVELYPTVEVAPVMPRTMAYLSHNAIPIQFTAEDFDQVAAGNFVTKVIYLPDAEFQDEVVAGAEELVSTRLLPGVDPIVEADKRGSILAIVRLGNKDLQVVDPGFGGEIVPTSHNSESGAVDAAGVPYDGHGHGAPMGMPIGGAPLGYPASGAMPPMVSGYSAPQYGMPMSGTPIGLPGPPHVPLGVPAGLQKHSIKNHTFVRMPSPTESMRIDVKQSPGFRYPVPANRMSVHEKAVPPLFGTQSPYGAGPGQPPFGSDAGSGHKHHH